MTTELLEHTETYEHALDPAAVGERAMVIETNPRLQRAIEIGTAIDPDHRLPEVAVEPDPEYRAPRGSLVPQKYLILHEGAVIGNCTVVSNNKQKMRWFNGVEVDEKGKGFGMAAYKTVIEKAMLDGYGFQTHDWSQTEGAKRVWERLAGQGVARVVRPFTEAGNGKYDGHFVIDAAVE